jgi:heme oxygenase (mycobilin-producing)
MPAAKTAATKAAGTTKNAASKPATVIVSYKVKDEDADNFLNAWERANDFLKKQPGHVSTTLHRAMSSNPPFRFVNVAKWKTVEDFRKATQSVGYKEAAGWLSAYSVYASVYDTVRS